MSTTFATLLPFAAEFPSTNYPVPLLINGRPVVAYDAAVDEEAFWTFICPQGFTGTIELLVKYIMASAISGTIDFEGRVEAVTPGDALDLDSAVGFDTPNTMTADTVPGTAGYMGEFTITLTNQDSISPGDYVRLGLKRDADDTSNDTATGDCYVLAAELRF